MTGESLKSPVGRHVIDPKKQLLAVLWLLATPDSYRQQVVEGFDRMGSLREVVGAIDGTYVAIKAPAENPQAYINRKCFYGITLQAICDDKRKFTDCFVGYPSSVSDIRIFRNSDIYEAIANNQHHYFEQGQFIIGDKAYPLRTWCVPPYIYRGLQDNERYFNTLHAKTRQVIERAFALLFGRFRRLRYLDMNRIDLIPSTIIAACVLHNICLERYDNLQNQFEQGVEFVIGGQGEIADRNNIDIGNEIRNNLAQHLYQLRA